MSNQERTVLFQLPTVISGQLVCTQGTLAGRSWNLSAGTFVIGRAPGSDMTLSAEPGVSKLHAKIVAEGDHYSLVDNESRNGTIVNGRPVQKVRLKTGDQIRICNCVLRFTQTGAGIPISAEGPPVSPDVEAPAFDLAPPTSPEVREMTAAAPPPSIEAPSPALPPPDVRSPAPVAPAPELSTGSVELPRPAPEVRVQSAMPWFAAGLALMVVVGGAGWAGLRFFGDALLGPMPDAMTAEASAKDPIALEREAEEARAKQAAITGEAVADDGEPARADDGLAAKADEEPTADDQAAPDDGEGAAVAAADDGAEEAAGGDDAPDEPDAPVEPSAATDPRGTKLAAEDADPRRSSGALDDVDDANPSVRKTTKTGRTAASSTSGDDGAGVASAAARAWYPVTVEREGPVSVRTRAGGTVASVAASDGQSVRKGEMLFSFEDAGGDEISNLRANIEALEAVAESQPSAQEMLERERDKLKRLLAKSGDVNVTAPAAGTLSGFGVKVGDVLKGGDTVGVVERGGATLVVNVPAAEGRRLKKGAAVELKTKSGTASGRVASVKRRGASYQVVLSTDASANDVVEARF